MARPALKTASVPRKGRLTWHRVPRLRKPNRPSRRENRWVWYAKQEEAEAGAYRRLPWS